MNKQQYIEQVHFYLKGMAPKDISDAIVYLDEYFEEAGVENEQKVIQELGTPQQYAQTIRADVISSSPPPPPSQNIKQSNKTTWQSISILILGIFALPIAVPLIFVALILIFTVLLVFMVLVFSLIIVLLSCIFSFFLLVFRFFSTIGVDMYDSLYLLGTILVSCGSALLTYYAIKWMVRKGLPALSHWIAQIYQRLRKKEVR